MQHHFQFLAVLLVAVAVSGDVSHLPQRYLPPPPPMRVMMPPHGREMAVSTTIEQQELRELPEQIEYQQPPMHDMPASRYLPPVPTMSQQQQREEDERMSMMTPPPPPTANYLPPMHMDMQMAMPKQMQMPMEQMSMPMPMEQQQMPMEQQQMPMEQQQMPSSRYLPPMPVDYEMMPKEANNQMAMPMPMPMSMEQEVATPAPAHFLAMDGYHYRTQSHEADLRLRH